MSSKTACSDLLIVVVFDPLAVVMLLAANYGLQNRNDPIVEEFVKNDIKPSKRKNEEKDVKEVREGEDWHPDLYTKMKKKIPGWIQRVKKLKDKRNPDKIEIDKNKIARM